MSMVVEVGGRGREEQADIEEDKNAAEKTPVALLLTKHGYNNNRAASVLGVKDSETGRSRRGEQNRRGHQLGSGMRKEGEKLGTRGSGLR